MASPSGETWLVKRKRLPCRIFLSRSSGAFVWPMEALQEVCDLLALLGATVELEDELRGDPQRLQALGELRAEEAAGVLQAGDGLHALALLAQSGDLDHRPAEVGGDGDL